MHLCSAFCGPRKIRPVRHSFSRAAWRNAATPKRVCAKGLLKAWESDGAAEMHLISLFFNDLSSKSVNCAFPHKSPPQTERADPIRRKAQPAPQNAHLCAFICANLLRPPLKVCIYLHMERNSRKIIARLLSEGFKQVSQKGSHLKFRKEGRETPVIVPHPKRDLPIGTARNIAKAAGWIK